MMSEPLVGIIMGSRSDWETMRHAAETLDELGVAHETKVVSAHRTPKRLYDYAAFGASERGLKVIIAGAGGAAHLPGMTASMTRLPVLGVPVESQALKGMDSLLSIVQMPAGVPVGTLAIGKAGAINAGAARRGDPRQRRRRAGRPARRLAREADGFGAPKRPNDRRAGLDHRHHRRRPARPDAGDRRGPARLQMPHLRPARAAAARRTSRRASRAPRSTTTRRCEQFAAAGRRRHLRVREFAGRAARRCSATSFGPAPARWPSPRTGRRRSSSSRAPAPASRRGARSPASTTSRARSPSSACRWCSRPAATAMTARARRGSAQPDDARQALGRDRRRAGGRRGRESISTPNFRCCSRAGPTAATRSGTARRTTIDDGILRRSTVPAAAPAVAGQVDEASAAALRIAEALDHVGVLTVEFFAGADGPLVNEIAPRVHNSGHWTIEGAVTSQFEQHIRAICGLPLGLDRPASRVGATMDNLIGDDVDRWPELVAEPGAHLHLYGKGEARPGRKMGHVTRVATSLTARFDHHLDRHARACRAAAGSWRHRRPRPR